MSSHSEIPYQTFYDIGTYMFQRWNEPRVNMELVLCELVALHQCRTDNPSYFGKKELCRYDVGSDNSDKSRENSSDNSSDNNVKSSDKGSDKSVKSISLHDCKKIKSINTDICSLCSDDTDNTVFKYYISDDEINIETE